MLLEGCEQVCGVVCIDTDQPHSYGITYLLRLDLSQGIKTHVVIQ